MNGRLPPVQVIRGKLIHKPTGYVMDVCEHDFSARWCYRLMKRCRTWAVKDQESFGVPPRFDVGRPITYDDFEITVERVHPYDAIKD